MFWAEKKKSFGLKKRATPELKRKEREAEQKNKKEEKGGAGK